MPKLVVEGLRDGDARALLGSALGVPLDERVQERLVAQTRGNPLALLELPRGLTPAELAGGFGLLEAPGPSGRIEGSFRTRLAGLPVGPLRRCIGPARLRRGRRCIARSRTQPIHRSTPLAAPGTSREQHRGQMTR